MTNTDPKKEIAAAKNALVERIREYARSQRELWQQVPLLALEADGRTGHSDNRSRAFRCGVWALTSSSRNGYYGVYVDLATGELISPFPFHDEGGKLVPARDEAVLALADHLDELDASSLLAELRKDASEPYFSGYDPAEKQAWRASIRAQIGLKERFTAEQRPPIRPPALFD